jgi:glyoxylase-like metal-dependent hydrolase (beta-lactamase superfamily II)
MRELADGAAILPGIGAVATYGHTPGHMSFHVADAGQSLYICGDAANRPELFLAHPDWHFVFDVDGPAASASRRRLFGRAADERALVVASHFPFPSFGHVARAGEGFRYVPVEWSSAV